MSETLERKSNFLLSSSSGFVSGVVNALLTQPIDTIKTRQQIAKLDPTATKYRNVFRKCISYSFLEGIPRVYSQEGFRALYRGLPPSLISLCTSMTLFFPTYEALQETFSDKLKLSRQNTFVVFPSVVFAWTLSSIFTSPISLLKVRLQTYPKTGFWKMSKKIMAEEGTRGFYSGYKGSWMFCILFGTHFALFEPLKRKVNDIRWVPFLSAATSSFAVLITYPNDLVVSRIMYQGTNKKYDGFLDCYKKIIKQDGIRSLYTGLSTQLTKFVVGSIITFTVYETMRNWNGQNK